MASTTPLGSADARAATRTFRPTFYFWMILVMFAFVFGGFGMTYWFPLATGRFSPAPPVVHLHGMVLFAWMILLIVQPVLVGVRNVALHRSVGTFGIALATAVIFMGMIITLLGAARGGPNPGPNLYHGIYLGFMACTGFGLLFTLAIRNVKRPEIHRRLILLSMLPLLPPGIHRFYMVPLGLKTFPIAAMYMTLDAMAIAIIVQEWRSSGRVGIYTKIGVAWIVVQQALHYPVTHSQWFADFTYAAGSMMHYR
jgi:hypothetical protein